MTGGNRPPVAVAAAAACVVAVACGSPAGGASRVSYAEAVQAARQSAHTPLVLPLLIAAARAPDPEGWLRRAAVESLGVRSDPTAVGTLVAVIEAPEGSVEFFLRRLAVRALGRIGTPAAIAALRRNLGRREGALALEPDVRAALAACR